MFRLGIIEESMESKEILEVLKPYFISQYIENVPEDECPVWHTNEYHVPEDRIWSEICKGGKAFSGVCSIAYI